MFLAGAAGWSSKIRTTEHWNNVKITDDHDKQESETTTDSTNNSFNKCCYNEAQLQVEVKKVSLRWEKYHHVHMLMGVNERKSHDAGDRG